MGHRFLRPGSLRPPPPLGLHRRGQNPHHVRPRAAQQRPHRHRPRQYPLVRLGRRALPQLRTLRRRLRSLSLQRKPPRRHLSRGRHGLPPQPLSQLPHLPDLPRHRRASRSLRPLFPADLARRHAGLYLRVRAPTEPQRRAGDAARDTRGCGGDSL